MQDLLPQNIQGPWEEIKKSSSTSLFYDDMFFDGAYCWFNCQRFDPGKIPLGQFGKFVFSFHTEFLEHEILIDFFSAHPDKDFLLISDWNYYDSIFPSIDAGDYLYELEHHLREYLGKGNFKLKLLNVINEN